jgi:hypothetical protein
MRCPTLRNTKLNHIPLIIHIFYIGLLDLLYTQIEKVGLTPDNNYKNNKIYKIIEFIFYYHLVNKNVSTFLFKN